MPQSLEIKKFSREHIIPSSIGGRIVVDVIICGSCNNYFGTKIDNKVLRTIEVIELSESFNIIDDASSYISSAYDIKITAEGHDLKGVMKKGQIKPLPQKITDDHLITPEKDTAKTLSKIVERNPRLKHLSSKQKKEALEKLLIEYTNLNFGEEVNCKSIGITRKKGITGDKVEYNAKESLDPLKLLIAKVIFEWLVIITYDSFFNSTALYNLLRTSLVRLKLQKGISIIRIEETQKPRPFHCVILQFEKGSTTAIVSLFSKITYQAFLPKIDLSFLEYYEKHYKTDSIVGIQIEDHFQKKERRACFLRENGERVPIAIR